MCEITVVRYLHPNGRKENVEKKRLCSRSDGVNPCLYHTRKEERTELVPPGTPSLVHDDSPSPASASIPGTPITATANYEIREPYGSTSQQPKGKKPAKSYGLYLDLGGKKKGQSSPKRRRSGELPQDYDDEDDDPIVGVEEDGRFEPITPTNHRTPSLGSPLSMRRPRQPPVISQPSPPLATGFRQSTPAPFHRRTSTAPESISLITDNEVVERANARDELRRQNRERQRHLDNEKRKREEADRKYAEALHKKELKELQEQAEDAASMREYQRLQEKDRAREEARKNREQKKSDEYARDQAEVDRIARELKERKDRKEQERKSRERARREAEEDARKREEARQLEERQKEEERLQERILQEELEQARQERLQTTSFQLREVQTQIEGLERELRQMQERRTARERAERLQEEIRQHNLLQQEIRNIEDQKRRDAIAENTSEINRLESEYRRLNSRIGEREGRSSTYEPVDGPRFNERRPITASSPRSPVDILQAHNPYEDAEYRRLVGEQILEQERRQADARDAALSLQGLITGAAPNALSRRNTVGGGSRSREQHYRDLRRFYPE